MTPVQSRSALREVVRTARASGARIGLVPTMGYLHDGHLSLVDRARQASDYVVVSIFVNPLQFGPGEDLARYPRDFERDAALLQARGAHLLFHPDEAEMYPAGEPAVSLIAPRLSDRLCGVFRPGHFEGVLTVVAKLFNIVQPDVAVFGRKDFQQLVLIRRMVRDLDFPVDVLDGPIVREPDGLAMSSRNVYLSGTARQEATLLRGALLAAQEAFSRGEHHAADLRKIIRDVLTTGATINPQYIELVQADTLDRVEQAAQGDVLALAAFVDGTRLIDNHTLH